jgi:hypothetical protein
VLCFRYKRFNFDISIRRPAQIAYVTSSHDYKYNPNAKPIAHDIHGQPIYMPQATIKLASDEMKSDYVMQIIGAGVSSINPIYVDLPDGIAEPEKYIIKNVIGVDWLGPGGQGPHRADGAEHQRCAQSDHCRRQLPQLPQLPPGWTKAPRRSSRCCVTVPSTAPFTFEHRPEVEESPLGNP